MCVTRPSHTAHAPASPSISRQALAMHPRVPTAASVSDDTFVRTWDVETGAPERTLRGHTGPVHGACFSPSGDTLGASRSSPSPPRPSPLGHCAYSGRAQRRAAPTRRSSCGTATRASASARCPATSTPCQTWPSSPPASTSSPRPGTRLPACGRWPRGARRTAAAARAQWHRLTSPPPHSYCVKTFTRHKDWVRAVAVSGDGSRCASGGVEHTVLVWEHTSGRLLAELRGHEHVIEALAFSGLPQEEGLRRRKAQDDVIKAARSRLQGKVRPSPWGSPCQWDPRQRPSHPPSTRPGAGTARWRWRRGGCCGCAHRRGVPPGLRLAGQDAPRVVHGDERVLGCAGARWPPLSLSLCLPCNTAAQTGHENWVRSLCMHPRAPLVLSCSDDKSIRVWCVWLARGIGGSYCRPWKVEGGERVHATYPRHPCPDLCRDMASMRCVHTLEGAQDHFVTAVAAHAVCPIVASGGVDKTVRVWHCI